VRLTRAKKSATGQVERVPVAVMGGEHSTPDFTEKNSDATGLYVSLAFAGFATVEIPAELDNLAN